MKKYVFAKTENLNKAEREYLASQTKNPKLLYRLAFDKCESVAEAVECNPATPKAAFKALLENYSNTANGPEHIKAIINNPSCDADLLCYILDNYDINVNHAAAILHKPDNKLTNEVLTKLVNSSDAGVRRLVARQASNLSDELVEKLAFDADPSVRIVLAGKTSMSPELLDVLSFDPNPEVRQRVASNGSADKDTALRLLTDSHPGVVTNVVRYRDDLTAEDCDMALDYVLENIHNPVNVRTIVTSLARKAQLSEEAMYKIARSNVEGSWYDNPYVVLARNINVPVGVLDILADKRDAGVLKEVLRNDHVTQEIIQKIANQNSVDKEVLNELLKRNADVDFLRRHMHDGWEMRESIAANPHTPKEMLEILIRDGSMQVRDRARASLTRLADQEAKAAKEAQEAQEAEAAAAAEKAKITRKPATKSDWSISPYELENYSDIADELDGVIAGVMQAVAKEKSCSLDYQFDNDNYDDADTITVSYQDGNGTNTTTLDAQRFLSILTSAYKKTEGVNKAIKYVASRI